MRMIEKISNYYFFTLFDFASAKEAVTKTLEQLFF